MQHIYKLLPLISFLFASCGDNTTTPAQPDVKSIHLDKKITQIYSTNSTVQLSATVTYEDGTTANATSGVTWFYPDTNDYTKVSMIAGNVQALTNGADVNVSIKYKNLNTDSQKLHVNALKTIRYTPMSDLNTTGEHMIAVRGDFDNNETNKTLQSNLSWLCDENSSFVSYDGNTSTLTLNITGFPTKVTAVLFDNNFSDYNISGK